VRLTNYTYSSYKNRASRKSGSQYTRSSHLPGTESDHITPLLHPRQYYIGWLRVSEQINYKLFFWRIGPALRHDRDPHWTRRGGSELRTPSSFRQLIESFQSWRHHAVRLLDLKYHLFTMSSHCRSSATDWKLICLGLLVHFADISVTHRLLSDYIYLVPDNIRCPSSFICHLKHHSAWLHFLLRYSRLTQNIFNLSNCKRIYLILWRKYCVSWVIRLLTPLVLLAVMMMTMMMMDE